MDPVEINAGAWYLRALRADDRMDDRPALAEIGITDPDYVAQSERHWSEDSRYTWAVCEPTTGEMLAEAALDVHTGEIVLRARPGHDGVADTATQAVGRFAGALGIS
ncbi:hypothetical protein [Mycobacterium sp. ACS4331]|uniref:hypothetical protein n=1 Tax=Mycobacterium sp. ACS4331 TaxID=1834121 RepID=UPI0007FCA826|nr:hypothetical protein [Mycobacterium sp. ACS4331]OBF27927.1 hypothetical protein A5727_02265 [Mycobacterium sp. ACS4331]